MKTEIGEYIVGAYLKQKCGCDFVDYNVRPPGGGLEGLAELDVVGLNFEKGQAFLCEVTTHLHGLRYGSYQESVEKVRDEARTPQSGQYCCCTSYTFEQLAHKFSLQCSAKNDLR